MTKRWPNNPTWQSTVPLLRDLAGRSWRRYGERLFGLHRGGLRAHIDRDLTEAEIVVIENKLLAALRHKVVSLRKRADATAEVHNAFDHECNQRRGDVRAAEFADSQAFVEALILEWCAENIQEAA